MAYHSVPIFAIGAVLLAYIVVIKVHSLITTYNFSRTRGCESIINHPQPERILGLRLYQDLVEAARGKRVLELFVEKFRQYGHTWRCVILGKYVIMTDEPANVKALLSTQFKDFSLGDRLAAFGPLLGKGIFTSDGVAWEHSRALVRPSFVKQAITELDTLESHLQALFSIIPKDKSKFDLQPLFFQLTLDNSTEFLLGESVRSLTSPSGSAEQEFGIKFDFAQFQLMDRLRLGRFVYFHGSKEFYDACKFVHVFVDKYVHKALQAKHAEKVQATQESEKKGKYIFLKELVQVTDDPIQIRSELLNILLAGRDTTAGTLCNTFFVLARRPEIWAKLRAEVDELGGKKPDYETLKGLKYLKWVLNESIRLFPSVPSNARTAVRLTTLPIGGGLDGKSPMVIQPGQEVSYHVHSMHRRKDIYGEDADEFRPERWETLRVGWEFVPFNGGPRICLGQQFALTTAGYTIVRLMQHFESFEARDPKSWCEGLHLTLSSGNGVWVAATPQV